MAITDDQRAMLQLLLDGGQSYDDIASLLGVEPSEIRRRARAALTEMGGADPDASVGLTDFLLGHADPIGRADAVRRLQNDADTNALANRLLAQLRLLSPGAQLPDLPAPKGGRSALKPAAPSPAPTAPAPSRVATGRSARAPRAGGPAKPDLGALVGRARSAAGSMSPQRSRLVAGAGALALLGVVGILAIAGVFGGGDGGGGAAGSECTTVDTSAALSSGVPAVTLTAAPGAPGNGDCEPTGQAVFASAQKQVVLQTNLANLAPVTQDQAYIIWLYRADDFAFPLAQDTVAQDGNLAGPAAIPPQVVKVIGAFGEIRVSLATAQEAQSAVSDTGKQGLPRYVGTTILSGPLPTALTQPQAGQAPAQGQQGQAPAKNKGTGGGSGN